MKLTRADVERMKLELAAVSIDATLKLEGADLSNVDLSGMDLRKCSFKEANLRGANFNKARLEGTNFWRACVCDASFYGASMEKCNLSSSCCEEASGLDYQLKEHTPENVNKAFKQRKWVAISDGTLRVLGPALKQADLRGMSETHRGIEERDRRTTPEGSENALIVDAERQAEKEML